MGTRRAELWVCARTDESPQEQQAFVFDTRPLSDQIQDVCGCFGLPCDHDEWYRVLTSGPSADSRPIRSEAEVLLLPPSTLLGLHLGSEVAEARISALRKAAQGKTMSPLRDLHMSIQGDHCLSVEVIEQGGINALLESVMDVSHGDYCWAESVELAMVCLSVLISLCGDEVRDWLSEHMDELGAPLFARLFAVLFPPHTEQDDDSSPKPSSASSDAPSRASLSICLFLLHNLPSCASAAAEAGSIGASKWGIKAAGGFGPAYPRMFAAMRGEEDRNEFQMSASVALLCALVDAAAVDDQLRPQVRNDFANFTSNEELDELWARDSREVHLKETLLSLAMESCSDLAIGSPEEVLKEVAQLRQRTQMMQETIEKLQVELQQRHRACCAMVPFMKVDSSLLVEQSLDSLVRFGWESISWRNNYTLLHFASDCLDDPRIIELVGSFAKDVDQRDDSGKRPIDYARKNACPEVATTMESLRKQQRQDACGKTAACLPDPNPVEDSAVDKGTADELRHQLDALEGMPAALREGIDTVLRLGVRAVAWPSGFSALHLAAQLGHVEATELLLRAKADPAEVDDWHCSPLYYAEQNHRSEVIRMLQAATGTTATPAPPTDAASPSSRMSPRGPPPSARLRFTTPNANAPDLTESRRSLVPGSSLGLDDDDEEEDEDQVSPKVAPGLESRKMSRSRLSRISLISDSDFGLSDQQLEDIGSAYNRSEVRHRALTSSTVDEAYSVRSSDYGLGAWQLEELQELERGKEVRSRLLTHMTNDSTGSARDSEYGFSEEQLAGLRRRYATTVGLSPGTPLLLEDDPDEFRIASQAASPKHRLESSSPLRSAVSSAMDLEGECVKVDTSGLSPEPPEVLSDTEYDISDEPIQRRLTDTSEKRLSTVSDSDFGLSSQQLASLNGKFGWAWQKEAPSSGIVEQDAVPSSPGNTESSARRPGNLLRARLQTDASVSAFSDNQDAGRSFATSSFSTSPGNASFVSGASGRQAGSILRERMQSSASAWSEPMFRADDRPTLRKRVSFKEDPGGIEEDADGADSSCLPVQTTATSSSRFTIPRLADLEALSAGMESASELNSIECSPAKNDESLAPEVGSHLPRNLESALAALFKDLPDFPADEASATGGSSEDAFVDTGPGTVPPGLEQSCRRACKLVMEYGWGRVNWDNNFTALHLAAHHGDVDAVRFLLQARASLARGLQDSSGMKPLDYAREAGCTGDLLELLQASVSRPAINIVGQRSRQGSADERGSGGQDNASGGPDSFLSNVSLGDAIYEKMITPRTREPDTALNASELQAKLLRVEKERAALLEQRNRPLLEVGAALSPSGILDESTMRKLVEQLQAFGRESVLAKVQEPPLSGGLALSTSDATRVVEQLEVVLRVCQLMGESASRARTTSRRRTKRHSTWNGGGADLAEMLGNLAAEEEPELSVAEQAAQADAAALENIRESWSTAAKEAAAIASSSFVGGIPGDDSDDSDGSGLEATPLSDPRPPEDQPEAPKADNEVNLIALVPKGKGKSKGPPSPKGKGKGAPPPGGKGKISDGSPRTGQPSKPKLAPEIKMKPLWWVRYLKGVHLKDGETVWDVVQDESGLLPVDLLHERFGAKVVKAAKTSAETTERSLEKEEQLPSLLRIITDPALIAGREAALKSLPPPQDVAAAIIELDEQVLPVDKMQTVIANACPTPLQVEELGKAREERPTVPFALPEQYMWVIMHIPAYKARLDCWSFVRTYTERRLQCVEALRRFEELTDCFGRSRNLPLLLGIILAVGNYLNGGTERGQADGFDLETLSKLDSVKDADGRDLRHLIFETFFNKCQEKACETVEELCPLLANVTRSLVRDSDGAEKLSKKVNVAIEDYDLMVNTLQDELQGCVSSAEMILQYLDDPADHFKLRMPEQIARAKDQIGALNKQRDRAKEKFGQLMQWFRVSASSGLKSSDFCLLWDELFIPEAMVIRRPAKIKKEYLVPSFCGQGRRITAEQLMVLWNLREPQAQKKAAPKAGLKGRRRDVRRLSLTQQRLEKAELRRKSLKNTVNAVIKAQRLSRLSSAARSRMTTEAEQIQEEQNIESDEVVEDNTMVVADADS